ncbi:nucleotidyl transferase AbiEii/AbiGii toxin family protein [Kitasatospora sp. NPDC004289]
MSPMTDTGRRLLADLLALGTRFPLVLGGDCAALAHGLPDRPVRTVELATASPVPLEELTARTAAELLARGWTVRVLVDDPLASALTAAGPGTGEEYGVELRKENFWQPPHQGPDGPVLALADLAGTKVRALVDRGLPRDLADLFALADRWSYPELETLGRRHTGEPGLDPAELQARLAEAGWREERDLARLGLDAGESAALRDWAQGWLDDLTERLMERQAPLAEEDDEDPDGES